MFNKIVFLVVVVAVTGLKAQSEQITEPCAVDDTPCIRDHFIKNSLCISNTFKSVPSSVSNTYIRLDAPYFNVTQIDQYSTIRNFNSCRITVFYQNHTAGATVVTITCNNINIDLNRAITAYRSGRTPRYYVIRIVEEYEEIAVTLVVRGIEFLDICKGTFGAYTSTPSMFLQAKDRASLEFQRNDPRGMFGENLGLYTRECWKTIARPFFLFYFNSMICHFQCSSCWTTQQAT